MISEKLLTHTVTLKKRAGIDRGRNEVHEEYTIERTRVTAEIGQTRGGEGETPSDTARLYIDAARSRIANAETELSRIGIAIGDKVEWCGREFTVQSITPCHAGSPAPHHWEVALK